MLIMAFAKTRITHFVKGELALVEFELPAVHQVNSMQYHVCDTTMRPGTAFVAEPFGSRTLRQEKRVYTRSNCAMLTPRILETAINLASGKEKFPNTSLWWQSKNLTETLIPIRLEFDETHTFLRPYEHTNRKQETESLALESKHQWQYKKILAFGFYTGGTAFAAYARYMVAHNFGISHVNPRGAHLTLIMSAQDNSRLLFHKEFEILARQFPLNFSYHPFLTRTWPMDWPYGRGRIIDPNRTIQSEVDMRPLLSLVPNLEQYHIRICGGRTPRDRIQLGLAQQHINPLSFRSECW